MFRWESLGGSWDLNGNIDADDDDDDDDDDDLVGGLNPLKNMSSSIGMMKFLIYGKIQLMATKAPSSYSYSYHSCRKL